MSDLETDNAGFMDFSSFPCRLHSFRGSPLAEQVPPERLARAGFYLMGDKVQCFSCKKTLDNWSKGDLPVVRHKEISPGCTFIRCVYPDSSLPSNGEYNEEKEDLEYRLRTGQVVDQTTYPKVPHMRSEQARLQTFTQWPSTCPVSPPDLAQAGFFYIMSNDHVQCFCCGGRIGGWEPGDTAWGEHERHYPNCFFILGHDVGNIPLQSGSQERTENRNHVFMGTFEDRLKSFHGIQHVISHERLAQAGLYSTGTGDDVMCFSCKGGLRGWQPEEDPWEEHAKHFPGCRFLLTEKGQEFINSIQLQGTAATSHQNGFSKNDEDNPTESTTEDEDPLKKLEKLQKEKQCKICMDRDISIVFIPCGHLVACQQCAGVLNKCPICCGAITQKVKTYIA
ncbi:hypothetical protein NL108_011867 [Boleophthalmus pectinirostris]|uniref:E3 ubiquitin-protein ligase XIAP n=1 Tax=Boleophthalmus pectinirostris TaxID=150288 RepID=UPI000A1C75BB|nr:E3 ubiquitin-protein ligase XIAP [Boleophthalmus pectinirostris]KAJ0050048.1 hypothetical protein NL108_011867 [Boleophthalmus pectinirostris]